MSNGVEIIMGKPTERDDSSFWELMYSRQTSGEPACDQTRPSAFK